jgi:peptidoglycan hydrolase-like protein with peptidoglycan-binding domain
VTGTYDWLTRRAVQTYQKEQGLDSATLSLAAARQLGLVAYDPSLIPPTPDI